ncbi:vanadium-dependent haloperoxidase [Maribacter chungangensis]|uniref:Vanadium-dependent haloperoxidase n=1 Tax=Maribacter chungangensis TaxID=1069117 RepID=A0ABW3B308_9FLAO
MFVLILWFIVASSALAQNKEPNYTPFMFSLDTVEISGIVDSPDMETKTILQLQQQLNDSLFQGVRYWNAAYPSYRWHQIMVTAGNRSEYRKNGGRMAILHLAVYDALAQVWKLKQDADTKAPFQQNKKIKAVTEPSGAPAFICEWSTAAAASHAVIGHYFPDQKAYLDSLLVNFKESRLRTGLQYEGDIEMGMAIGRGIARQYIDYSKTDRTNAVWTGTVPTDKSLWTATPSKWDPMKAQWKPFTLAVADQFRPGPPPSDWTAEMEELRQFNTKHKSSDIAFKWKSEPVWDNLLALKILEYDLDPFQAARANALFHMARFDATIAAWDGKYHYWGIRPFQYDPTFKPILIETPNFPGYPAGHTTIAGALAMVLSKLFPHDAAQFEALAWECSESRFEGGVHFRTDNEVGLIVGEKVGRHVWDAFQKCTSVK